ncbi:hypothetical protein EMIT0P294_160014 [Pseudomonas sp. IT-P294]
MYIQHVYRLTHRYREQAHSHKGPVLIRLLSGLSA